MEIENLKLKITFMSWLFFVICAHLLSAIVFIVDKYILSQEVKAPITYAFYNGILSVFVILLLPLGPILPQKMIMVGALLAGILFTIAVIFFYLAIEKNPTSRIIPLIGTMVPIFTFALSYSLLGERLTRNQFIAFYLLILGGILITSERRRRNIFSSKGVFYGILAALCFAASFILTKYTYNNVDFWSGFIWTRMGSIILALIIFLVPHWRKKIKKAPQHVGLKVGVGYLSIRALSAFSFIILNYAIFLSSVTLVNALQGVQYIFLIIIALILTRRLPQLFAGEFKNQQVQKIIAVILITFGLAILAFK